MADLLREIAQLTAEQRAKVLELARRKRGRSVPEPGLRRIRRQGRFPMSYSQHRMWFLTQLEPGSPYYNGPDRLRICGGFNVATWQQTLREIERRQEVWRTSFRMSDLGPEQVVHRAWDAPMPCLDLSGLEPRRREATVRLIYFAHGKQNYYPEVGPLMHNYVCRLGAQEYEWGFTRQHLHNDWPSDELIMLDWEKIYAEFFFGRPSPLPELEIQQVDFAVWHRLWLTREKYDKQLAYWRKQLADLPPETTLPYDRPRPRVYDYEGRIQHYAVDGKLWNAVKALGRQEGVTPTMMQLAATAILIGQWTGQAEASIAQQIDIRNRRQLEPLGGFMVNTIVTRIDLAADPTCRELLQRVKRVNQEAWDNRDIPFQDLVKVLNPARSLSRTPLFQIFFTVLNYGLRLPQFPECTTRSDYEAHEKALFDLTALTFEFGDIFRVSWEFSSQLFDATTIRRWSAQWERLLEGIVANPDAPISTLALLTPEEEHQLLEWRETLPEVVPSKSIVELFCDQVSYRPDAVAVTGDGEHLTYESLQALAAVMATELSRSGVGLETPVGLCLGGSPEWAAAVLALFSVGGTYVPLDPSEPIERRAFVAEDTAVVAEISVATLPAVASCAAARLELPDRAVGGGTRAAALAYVIYTSGSTGVAKGVAIEQAALLNHRQGFLSVVPLGCGDRVLQFAAPVFDVSLEEIVPCLTAGATLVLSPGRGTADPVAAVVEEAVTVLSLPTSLWRRWVHVLSRGKEDLPSALRAMVIGSESAVPEDAAAWLDLTAARISLHNLYGPTEATITATSYQARGRSDAGCTTLPIGRPLANVSTRVTDRDNRPTAIGLPGLLCLGGAGVARGYLGRSELTAEHFICVPGAATGERAYTTGDRARFRRDARLEFLGRADRQLKVRGFRVEPAEVEVVLVTHPDVEEAAVMPDDTGDRLVAYVAAGGRVTPARLRGYLSERLPDHMVPSVFVLLPTLPRTPGGKVDRNALPSSDGRARASRQYVAPRNAIEERVARIWGEELGVESVGIHDDFFALAGHSLAAVAVTWRIRVELGLEVPVRSLFESPTVADLCNHLARWPD